MCRFSRYSTDPGFSSSQQQQQKQQQQQHLLQKQDETSTSSYSSRIASRADVSPYPPAYPPQLRPRVRYPFPPHDSRQSFSLGRRPRSPDYHPSSPPYHRDGHYGRHGEPVRFYPNSPRGYYIRPGYEREADPAFYMKKEEYGRMGIIPPPRHPASTHPPSHGSYQMQEYRNVALEHSQAGYSTKRSVSDDVEYSEARKYTEDERSTEVANDQRYRNLASTESKYVLSNTAASKDSPSEYIQPRVGEDEGRTYEEEGGERAQKESSRHSSAAFFGASRAEDEHRALFRGKPSISYGDYAPSSTLRNSGEEYATREYPSESSYPKSSGPDPGEFITMATEQRQTLIQPRPPSVSPEISEAQSNVFVDEPETPIVTPSDDLEPTTPTSSDI